MNSTGTRADEESEWTSIAVTREQKDALEDLKPEGMTMGVWLLEVVERDRDAGAAELSRISEQEALLREVREELLREVREELRQTPERTAEELESRLR